MITGMELSLDLRTDGAQPRRLRWALMAVGFGLVSGLCFLVSLPFGFLSLFAPLVLIVAVRYSLLWWIAMMTFMSVISSHVAPPVGSSVSWLLMVLFLVSCWYSQRMSRRAIEWGDGMVWMCIAGFLGWGILSTCCSLDGMSSVREMSRYGFSFLYLLAYLNWLRGSRQIKTMIGCLEILSVVMACICLAEGYFWMKHGYTSHVVGVDLPSFVKGPYPPTFGEIGCWLAAMIPISTSFLLGGSVRHQKLRVLGVLLMWLGVYVCSSRASTLAAFVGSCIIFMIYFPPRVRKWILIVSVTGLIFFVVYLWGKYGNPVTGALHNLSGRNLLWAAAMQATGEKPVLGVGPGCWSIWLRSHYVAADFIMGDFRGNRFALSPSMLGGEAHNLFFTKMAEMGIPALVWIACMFLTWFFKARSAVKKLPKGWGRVLGMGSLAAVIGLFVRCFFENGPIIGKGRGSEVIVVWFIVALPFVLRHLDVSTETIPGQGAVAVQRNQP